VYHFEKMDKLFEYGQIVDPDGISPNMALSIKGRTANGSYLLDEAGK